MQINGIDISTYKAKLLERVIDVAEKYNNNSWSNKEPMPTIETDYFYSHKQIRLKFDIIAKSTTELEMCKGKLTKALEKATIRFADIDMNYTGYYTETPKTEYVTKYNDTLEFTFYAYAWKEEKTETFNKTLTKTISVTGNQKTPCIIEINPTASYGSLTLKINSRVITIKNITANKKIILDGSTGKFTEETNNKFNDIDLWEKPYLDVGNNTLTIDKDTCNITIKYKNIFI